VRGVNARARQDAGIRPSVLCLQETKLDVIPQTLIMSMLGSAFTEFAYLPTSNTRGGILIAGHQSDVAFIDVLVGCFSITVSVVSAT
jgi:hypothetical protein